MDSEVVEVLKEIRDEVRGTNARLDQTNTRLESLEKRVDVGFENTNARISLLEGRLQFVEQSVTKGFQRVTESISGLRTEITAALKDHEHRIRALEKQQG